LVLDDICNIDFEDFEKWYASVDFLSKIVGSIENKIGSIGFWLRDLDHLLTISFAIVESC
jgi:hypothetical protein